MLALFTLDFGLFIDMPFVLQKVVCCNNFIVYTVNFVSNVWVVGYRSEERRVGKEC